MKAAWNVTTTLDGRPAMPIRVAAARLGVSPATVRRYIRNGDIQAVDDPHGRLITSEELASYLDRKRGPLPGDLFRESLLPPGVPGRCFG